MTYGQRLHYVLIALASALAEGVHHAVVIDNGSLEPVEGVLRKRFGDWLTIARFDTNQGSASGFKRGMQLAYDSGCALILLLDDDNQLTSGCLKTLISARQDLADRYSDDNCMVLAYRPGHQPAERIEETNGYLGFHVKDIPTKLGKRIGLLSWVKDFSESLGAVQLPYAPYSGLLFDRSVIERHGLPDERFVLYGDDSEFSYRVTASAGRIALIPQAVLVEQDRSWNAPGERRSYFRTLIIESSEFRVFYAVRNRCYFEQYCRTYSEWKREVNRIAFSFLLLISCLLSGRYTRWKLLSRAMHDGKTARLGVCAEPSLQLP